MGLPTSKPLPGPGGRGRGVVEPAWKKIEQSKELKKELKEAKKLEKKEKKKAKKEKKKAKKVKKKEKKKKKKKKKDDFPPQCARRHIIPIPFPPPECHFEVR